jgi:peptidoglycan-associated lipoprotein
MRNLSRTLVLTKFGVAVFAAALMISAAGCKKKAPIVNNPPPTTAGPTRTAEPPPPAPLAVRINSFTGEPRSIERGQSATLRWSVGNSTDISIDQNLGPVAANGTRQVFPSQTTTYTLTAKGGGAQDTRSVTIEVSSSVPPPPPRPTGQRVSGADMLRAAQDVYFDYDKNDIRAEGRDTLTKDADVIKGILQADPGFTIVIEGHCDERGSEEYNLALGDRRAIAVKEFLVQLGVPDDRLKTISFGKERPVCTDQDEGCYQKNRRGHLAPAQ